MHSHLHIHIRAPLVADGDDYSMSFVSYFSFWNTTFRLSNRPLVSFCYFSSRSHVCHFVVSFFHFALRVCAAIFPLSFFRCDTPLCIHHFSYPFLFLANTIALLYLSHTRKIQSHYINTLPQVFFSLSPYRVSRLRLKLICAMITNCNDCQGSVAHTQACPMT